MHTMTDHQNSRTMTTARAKAILLAWPKRVPFFNDEQIIRCTACRACFSTGTAWKIHRRTGVCDTTRLRQNGFGVWLPPRRKRVQP